MDQNYVRRYLVFRDGSSPVFFTVVERLPAVANVGVKGKGKGKGRL